MASRRRPVSSIAVSVGAVVGLASPCAGAEGRLVYRAPPECATRADFVSAVVARGGHFDRGGTTDAGRVMQVFVKKEGESYSGSLQVELGGAQSMPREVHGDTCTEVVEALAVVVAIALRPESEGEPPPVRVADPRHEPAPAPVSTPVATPEPERPPLKATSTNVWPAPFDPGDRKVDVPAGTLHFESITSVTWFGGAAVGVIPGLVMPRIDISISRANFVTPPGNQSYMVGPLWRIRASLLGDVQYRSGDLTTDVGGQAIGSSLCYSPYFDAGGFGALFCLEVGAEMVHLRTKDASGATIQSKSLGSGTVGFSIETVYNIGRHFQLALKLGADAATSPFTAERADGSQIFTSSWLSGYAALGLGAHW